MKLRELKLVSKSEKGGNFEMALSLSLQRWIQVLIFIGGVYLIFIIRFSSISQEPVITRHYNELKIGEHNQLKAPSRPSKHLVSSPYSDSSTQKHNQLTAPSRPSKQRVSSPFSDSPTQKHNQPKAPSRPLKQRVSSPFSDSPTQKHNQLKAPSRPLRQRVSSPYSDSPTQTQLTTTTGTISKSKLLSNISFDAKTFTSSSESGVLQLYKAAKTAYEAGIKLWEELESGNIQIDTKKKENLSESCTHSIILSGSEFENNKNEMILPCGLTLGSHITIVGVPRAAHAEKNPNIALMREGQEAMVSQFSVELRGLKMVEGEEPPRIFHFNPRLKGDFSGKPVIEQNSCYRMQWGPALRCQGWPSMADDETDWLQLMAC